MPPARKRAGVTGRMNVKNCPAGLLRRWAARTEFATVGGCLEPLEAAPGSDDLRRQRGGLGDQFVGLADQLLRLRVAAGLPAEGCASEQGDHLGGQRVALRAQADELRFER